ncbi:MULTISPECIES: hypothetical protein [unclassified Streptomyces]|uniref:hypothetical protein n=1 Tax=unclassified Streptomyces TaxID=2593676 RepID=UPI0001C18AF2|nr:MULTISPECIES: hypothetical protein [unclassified Streptomyces]AEN11340.1 hypothetical protein SACTE_3484 [Streptomyces sp. SirexAA-E]MYR67541.1 hypothetical protein [Streptomyces sp. SID4939]MYR99071.1 hypothetical protein [Streptomyces sp. SID4940]MYT63396.1 hypothetical protein [Streptomyces sp. SID8357]MYT85646.1 hypothetical protein [Streptomyces sp. SID8360]
MRPAISETLATISLPNADSPLLAVIVLAVAAGLLRAGLRTRRSRRPARDLKRKPSAAVVTAAVAALVCTAYSADTSWRFAAHHLGMRDTTERAVMFAAAELALFSMALMARQNLHGPRSSAGLPGVLVWAITTVQTIPAYAESGPVGGTVRAFTGPVMAAVLWHLAMGIELRQHTPDSASRGLAAVLIRQARERLLARLGIVERDQGAAQIVHERATRRAVALAARLAEMTPGQRTGRKGRRTVRRLSKALARSGVDADTLRNEQLLRQLATRRQAADLATINLPGRWTPPSRRPAAQPDRSRAEAANRAEGDGRAEDRVCPRPADPGGKEPQPGARPEFARPDLTRSSPETTVRPPEAFPPPTGSGSHTAPAKRPTSKPKRPGSKPRATDDVLRHYAHRLLHEHGSLSRDLLEEVVRGDGYTVASDTAGLIVRAVKAELNAARQS